MKKLIIILAVVGFTLINLLLTGCTTAKSLSGKSVILDGHGGVSKVTTAFDPATGTPAPQVVNVIGEVTAATIHNGKNSKDVIFFTKRSDCSIFNSDAKTDKTTFILGSTNQELIKTAVDAIAKKLTENDKSKCDEVSNE